MTYTIPDSKQSRLYHFVYADPDDIFMVTDCFHAISRYVDQVGRYHQEFGVLAKASLELFGWGHLPLTQALGKPEIDRKTLLDERSKDGDGEEVYSLRYYWELRTGLIKLPLTWERPNILVGDTMCHSHFRRRDWGKHPTFAKKPYFALARQLREHDRAMMKTVLDFDAALVSVYGAPTKAHLTVGELLAHNPKVADHFFCPWNMM